MRQLVQSGSTTNISVVDSDTAAKFLGLYLFEEQIAVEDL